MPVVRGHDMPLVGAHDLAGRRGLAAVHDFPAEQRHCVLPDGASVP